MHAERNKAIVWRFYEELWNSRRIELAEELIAVDCVTHQLSSGSEPAGVPRGPDAMKHHIAGWLASFPDLRFTVEQTLAEGDHVVTRNVMRGTQTGEWLGVAPTGKQVTIRMIVIQRIADGKIAEDWVLVESLGLLQQLGLIPSTADILQRN